MFKLKRAVIATAAVALLALSGCAAPDGNDEQPNTWVERGDTLTWGTSAQASTFAQKDMRWENESPYAQAIYDTLLRAAPDGEIEAGLATDWEYNEDNTVLTLTLRDDVTFTNGEPLTATDAEASLLAFKSGSSPAASNLASLTDVTAVDDDTLELTLDDPNPALLTYLTQNTGLVAPADLVDDPAMATDPVGSGPYILNTAETVVGSSYVFDRNEDYWKQEDQHYEKLVIQYYADPTSLLNAVQGGQVNVTNTIDRTTIPQMQSAGYTANEYSLNWWGFLVNDREGTIVPALGDVRVRQAINHALDREALVTAVGNGYGTPTTQIFPTYSPSFQEELDELYDFDVDRAKELMAEAGYEDGFEVTMPRSPAFAASSFTLYADQLAQIGITVNYEDVQASDYLSSILSGKYAMAWFALKQDASDYQLARFQIAEDATWNVLGQSTPEVEDLIATIRTAPEDEALAAGQELNRYVVENAWFAPMYRPTSFFMSDANTRVQTQLANSMPYLWNVQPAE